MGKKLATLFEIIKIMEGSGAIGDAAALKLTLTYRDEVNSPHSASVKQLADLTFEHISFEKLHDLPPDSFGRAYLDFMTRNRLRPLNFTGRVRSLFEVYPVTMRYTRIHDMVHVILGFETDVAGELGVYAFISRQSYGNILDKAARAARIASRILRPFSLTALAAAEARGYALSQDAKPLVCERLEDMLSLPLTTVRERLCIPTVV